MPIKTTGKRSLSEKRFQKRNVNRLKKVYHVFSNNLPDNPYSRPVEKGIRITVHVLAVLGMSLMILDVTIAFRNSPTVTTAETYRYPVQKIDFPAIAICSINRISQKAAISLAEELLDFETTTYNANLTRDDLVDMIKILGNFYRFKLKSEDLDKLNLLHTIFERGYNGYDVGRLMRRVRRSYLFIQDICDSQKSLKHDLQFCEILCGQLTPKCRSILRRCSWEGKDKVCDDIFFLRNTDSGYCCMFNYVRQNDKFGRSQNSMFTSTQIQKTTDISAEYGLSVLLNPQVEDYAYELLPSKGFKIMVYLSLDYPDAASGGLREILIPSKTENYLDLDAVTFYSVPDVEQYDIHKRDCLFSTEQSRIFNGHYSYSDCIVHCRTKDILEHCNCIPFFYPTSNLTGEAKVCNLKDLTCLHKYRDRWLRLKPRYENNMHIFNEQKFDGKAGYITCDCLPSCEDISYTVSISSVPITVKDLSWGRTKFIVKNHSIVHIFFGKSGTLRLRQDVLFYWYELMSNYGGICSLFLGVSIINVIEILYKAIFAVWQSESTPKSSPKKTNDEAGGNNEANDSSVEKAAVEPSILYWDEITRAVTNYNQTKFPSLIKF